MWESIPPDLLVLKRQWGSGHFCIGFPMVGVKLTAERCWEPDNNARDERNCQPTGLMLQSWRSWLKLFRDMPSMTRSYYRRSLGSAQVGT